MLPQRAFTGYSSCMSKKCKLLEIKNIKHRNKDLKMEKNEPQISSLLKIKMEVCHSYEGER